MRIILIQEWSCSSPQTDINCHLNSTGMQPIYFSAYPYSLKGMFMSRENLGSLRTWRFRVEETRQQATPTDISITKTVAQIDQVARMLLEYVWRDTRKRGCLTSNSKIYSSDLSMTSNISGRLSARIFFNLTIRKIDKGCDYSQY